MSTIRPHVPHPLEAFDPRWYAKLFDGLGARYDDFSFTRGTEQEAAFLAEALGLEAAQRLLDVGCGSGRHAVEMAARGVSVTGVDLSSRLLEIGLLAARRRGVLVNFIHGDARELAFTGSFDAAVSLCEGAFGLLESPEEDLRVLVRMRAALRVGGRLALETLNRRYLDARREQYPGYDPASGYTDYQEEMSFESGRLVRVRYRDRAFYEDDLTRLVESAGYAVTGVHGSMPGDYGRHPVDATRLGMLLFAVAA